MVVTDRAKALRPLIQTALDEGGIDAICELIAKLEARITELEKRLNKNSSNSSKPPSSDGLKRTKSLRPQNTGRKPGGQPGHRGQTLLQSESPDVTLTVPLDTCPECGGDLSTQPVVSGEKRQVFDLPDIRLRITEYLAQHKFCPHCGKLVSSEFPTDVTAPAQYGPGMHAAMTYLNVRQVIPCKRVAEVCQDIFGHRPSAGSVVRSTARCAGLLAPAVDEIRNTLRQAPVLHSDEPERSGDSQPQAARRASEARQTGVRCAGKTQWLHVASTATDTFFSFSPKRGVEGFAAADILPGYGGTLVHDFWGPYDTLGCRHSRCNAHLLRELKSFVESGHRWAQKLIAVLLEMKQAADEAREKGQLGVAADRRKKLEGQYDKWVSAGLKAHPEELRRKGRRGRVKQSAETNLLRRLRDKREEVLRFFSDLEVPFDNN